VGSFAGRKLAGCFSQNEIAIGPARMLSRAPLWLSMGLQVVVRRLAHAMINPHTTYSFATKPRPNASKVKPNRSNFKGSPLCQATVTFPYNLLAIPLLSMIKSRLMARRTLFPASLSMRGQSLCRAALVFRGRVRVLGLEFCVRVRIRVRVTGNVTPCITFIVPSIRQAS